MNDLQERDNACSFPAVFLREETMYKAVLFDFDDTLGDREAYTYQLYRHFVCDLGYDPDALETEVMVQDLMLWDQYGTAGMAYIESKLMEKYNPDLSRTGSLLDYWVNNIGQYAVLLPHAEETLRLLKEEGWILGIVTNGTAKGQSEKIEHTGIARFMDDIVISQSAGCRKPDPRIFQLSAERLHIKPQECIFVGDIWNTDMIGSRNAGMKPVWYWPHGTRVCTWPVDRISSLKELPELVRGFNHEV